MFVFTIVLFCDNQTLQHEYDIRQHEHERSTRGTTKAVIKIATKQPWRTQTKQKSRNFRGLRVIAFAVFGELGLKDLVRARMIVLNAVAFRPPIAPIHCEWQLRL